MSPCPQPPLTAQGTIEVKKKKGEIPEQPKGIYTGPAKKGTFGYNKTTLSERMGYKGVATEWVFWGALGGVGHDGGGMGVRGGRAWWGSVWAGAQRRCTEVARVCVLVVVRVG